MSPVSSTQLSTADHQHSSAGFEELCLLHSASGLPNFRYIPPLHLTHSPGVASPYLQLWSSDALRNTSWTSSPTPPASRTSSKACRNRTGVFLFQCSLTSVPALLHTIFFHRLFPPLSPLTRDLLDLTLPAIDDVDLETLIEQRATTLVRALESSQTAQRGRAQLCVLFFEKRRRKAYFVYKEDDVCWEQWTLDVTLATPRTESGTSEGKATQQEQRG